MRDVHPEKVRNIALISHQSAGKSTLAESMLHRMGVITRMGSIDDGNTVSDYKADEISRKMSISSTLVIGEHKGTKINILDTPGFTDFSGEVIGSVRVADSACVLINASAGVEVGTDLVWNFAEKRNMPRFFFINHLDKENVVFDNIAAALKERFEKTVLLQFPVNPGNDKFDQIVDLLTMKLITFENGGEKTKSDLTGDLKEKATEMKQELIETVAEADDELMEKFFENDGLSEDDIKIGLNKGFREGTFYPVLCGAAKRQVGTSLLLNFIVDVAPSPLGVPGTNATKPDSDKQFTLNSDLAGSTAAFIFKTVSDKHVGDLSYFRVFSGTVKVGDDLRNVTRGQTEKIGQVFTVTGKNRTSIDEVPAGDMGALVKLKDTHTSDTLSNPKEEVIIEKINLTEPVARIAIVPKTKGEEEKMANGLHILAEEDPSFRFNFDPELAQLIVSGQGELHLNIIIAGLKDRFGVEVEKEEPRIPYRETIKSSAEGQGKYKKQSGGRGQYGDCWLKLESRKRGEGFEFVNAIVGGVIPSKFVPAVEKGVFSSMEMGVISGFPVVDVKVTCYDGSYHTVDSSENAFRMAGSMAFRKVFQRCKPIILEPIEDLEARVPEEFMGDVMGDISSRRGKIMGMEPDSGFQVIRAKMPLAELHMYSSTLRSLTGGRGLHKSSFSHYEQVPSEIQDKLVEDYEARRAEGLN